MSSTDNTAQKTRVKPPLNLASYLPPYLRLIDHDKILLDDNKILSTIAIKGTPFALESQKELDALFNAYKESMVTIGKGNIKNLEVKTTLIKSKINLNDRYVFPDSEFIQRFADKYIKSFNENDFYDVTYFISFTLKFNDLENAVDDMSSILKSSMGVLRRFNAEILSTKVENYIDNNTESGVIRSYNTDFIYYLLNHKKSNLMPLTTTEIVDSISNTDLYFGYDYCECRNRDTLDNFFMTSHNLSDYPTFTRNGMWDKVILTYPCEFILSQTFTYFSLTETIKKIDDQLNKLRSTNDSAIQQQEELEIGKATVLSGEVCFGSYQSSLIVFGDSPDKALEHSVNLCAEFASVNESGARFVRCTYDAIYSFFSIFPSSKFKPIQLPHTTTNLVCGHSLHNHSIGKQYGNPIGDGSAIMPVKTMSKGLYFLNTHYSNPLQDVTGEMIAGHTLILGMTGAGKTTLQCAIMAFLTRFNPCMFGIDFNRSFELAFRAFGGSYVTIQEGKRTGLNPFQLEEKASPKLLSFLYKLVKRCAVAGYVDTLSVEDEQRVTVAVDSIMSLPLEARRFSLILQTLADGTELKMKLARWCESANGEYAWALDSPINQFNPHDYRRLAFDGTEILKAGMPVTEPILATLFFYKELMQRDGELMLTTIEEFWVPCNYPLTQELIKASLKAGRLKGEFVFLVSQSPEDAISCPIFKPIVEQTPTKIMLPNPSATYENNYSHVGLTPYEFEALVRLDKESRRFMVKQSQSASICEMDLHGFEQFLPILSGSTKNINLCERLREELNTDNPDIWIPEFLHRIGVNY